MTSPEQGPALNWTYSKKSEIYVPYRAVLCFVVLSMCNVLRELSILHLSKESLLSLPPYSLPSPSHPFCITDMLNARAINPPFSD
jgi:hypothetical protein